MSLCFCEHRSLFVMSGVGVADIDAGIIDVGIYEF